MKESLNNLFTIKESLFDEKEKLRKDIFEKYNYFKSSKDLRMEESVFFKNVSLLINDKEFEKIRRRYEKLCYLLSSINELQKEY